MLFKGVKYSFSVLEATYLPVYYNYPLKVSLNFVVCLGSMDGLSTRDGPHWDDLRHSRRPYRRGPPILSRFDFKYVGSRCRRRGLSLVFI